MPPRTIEEAQERILELTEQVQTLTAERDTLSRNNESLNSQCEELREMNQRYFNKLIAQNDPAPKEEPEPEAPTCEEFAMTINI